MIPEKIPVQSDHIQFLGYQADTQRLWVQFRGTSNVYIFPQVSLIDFENVLHGRKATTDGRYPSIASAFEHFVRKSHPDRSTYDVRSSWT